MWLESKLSQIVSFRRRLLKPLLAGGCFFVLIVGGCLSHTPIKSVYQGASREPLATLPPIVASDREPVDEPFAAPTFRDSLLNKPTPKALPETAANTNAQEASAASNLLESKLPAEQIEILPPPEVDLSMPIPVDTSTNNEDLPSKSLPLPEQIRPLDAAMNPVGQDESVELPLRDPQRAELTIDDARAASLQNNLALMVQRVQPSIARAGVDVETGRFQQIFSGAIFHSTNDPPPGNFSFGAQERQETDLFYSPFGGNSLAPTVTMPLTTGGAISIEQGLSRLEGASFDENYDHHLGIGLSHPLLRGNGTEVNTAGIRLANVDLTSANASVKLASIRILTDLDLAYWELYVAHHLREIAQQHVKLAEQQSEISAKLLAARIVSSVDIDRAEVGRLLRESRLADAETRSQLAVRAIKQIMQQANLPVESMVALVPTTAPAPAQPQINRELLVQLAIDNRMELVIQELEILRATIDRMVQRNASRPRLDLTTRYALLGTGNRMSRAVESTFDDGFSQWFVGLVGEFPLASGVSQSAAALARQADFRRAQATLARDNLRVLIRREVLDAADRLERSYRVLKIAVKNVKASENALQGEFKLFQRGLRTSTDVLIADQLLIDAQTSQVNALGDFSISKALIAQASGTVLGYSGVTN